MHRDLTVAEFQSAVHKGMGRAILAIHPPVSNEFADIILEACRKDKRHDRQLEERRTNYLMNLVDRADLRDRLFSLLESQIVDHDSWESIHRFRLLGALLRTHPIAQEILQKACLVGELDAADPLVENGQLTWVVENVLPLLPKRERWRLKSWRDEQNPLASPYKEVLDDAIADFEASLPSYPTRAQAKTDTFEELLESIANSEMYIRGFRKLADDLTEGQIEMVANLWLAETNWRRGRNYRDLFEYCDFPFPVSRIIEQIRSGIEPIQFEEVIAFERDPDARAFGIELIEKGDYRGYKCMASSWEDGDLEYMFGKLDEFKDADEDTLHVLCIDLLNDFTDWTPEESQPFLIWIYENSPCSYCRGNAASDMHKAGTLPEVYREELQYDADSGARELVNNQG